MRIDRFDFSVIQASHYHEVGWVRLLDGKIVLPLVNVPGAGAVVLFSPTKGVRVKGGKDTFSEVADGLEVLLNQPDALRRLGLSLDPRWVVQVKAERDTYFAAQKQ